MRQTDEKEIDPRNNDLSKALYSNLGIFMDKSKT